MGKVTWISVRPKRREDPVVLQSVNAIANFGLEGDHYQKPGGSRQITLIERHHLDKMGEILNTDIDPAKTRRNIVVDDMELLSLIGKTIQIGEVNIKVTGPCKPCSRMEENFGLGGLTAMSGNGGITAEILKGGIIKLGDSTQLINP